MPLKNFGKLPLFKLCNFGKSPNLVGTMNGAKLKQLFDMYRLKPEEVAGEAKMSTVTLRKVFKDEAPADTVTRAATAIESCRQRLLSSLQSTG